MTPFIAGNMAELAVQSTPHDYIHGFTPRMESPESTPDYKDRVIRGIVANHNDMEQDRELGYHSEYFSDFSEDSDDWTDCSSSSSDESDAGREAG